MEKLLESMKVAMELIEETAGLFYQQKQQEGLQKLEQMIAVIMAMLENVRCYQKDQPILRLEERQFNLILTNALEVLAQKDYVLLADILTFEVNGVIGNALKELQLYANS